MKITSTVIRTWFIFAISRFNDEYRLLPSNYGDVRHVIGVIQSDHITDWKLHNSQDRRVLLTVLAEHLLHQYVPDR